MISINGKTLEINHFPDRTLRLNYLLSDDLQINIDWKYEGEEELVALIYLTKHIKSQIKKSQELNLLMKYIPNARYDRTKNNDEIFTLKYFAEIINMLDFDRVVVLDPHSYVSEAVFNKLYIQNPKNQIEYIINTNNFEDNLIIYYPDKGAYGRYNDLIKFQAIYGEKQRDWKSGKILGLDIVGDIKQGQTILIIDDICSKGGTFLHSARKLKELGAGDIYLYVTHCENTILDGELINSGLIKKIYTTDSIFTKEHSLIEVMKL